MSDLEQKSMGVVSPMIQGTPLLATERLDHLTAVTLLSAEQALVALWALKTAFMLDLTTERSHIPQSHYRSLYLDRAPHPNTHVWLGAYRGGPEFGMAVAGELFLKGAFSDEMPPSYVVTFNLGYAVFQVFGTSLPDPLDLAPAEQFEAGLIRLWPPSPFTRVWPPHLILTDESFHALAWDILQSEPSAEGSTESREPSR